MQGGVCLPGLTGESGNDVRKNAFDFSALLQAHSYGQVVQPLNTLGHAAPIPEPGTGNGWASCFQGPHDHQEPNLQSRSTG